MLIETRTYTGPWLTTRRRASRSPVSSRNASCLSWLSSNYPRCQQLNLATRYVEVAPLLRMLLVRLVLSSWLGTYGSLSRQRSYTSTLWCNRPQKLSSSSATFCHASCLWKHQSFGKLDHCCALPIDLSDAMEALLEFDDSRHRAPLGQLRLSFSTMACAILISPRQSEIAARRIRQAHHRCLHCCYHGLGLMEVSCFSAPLHRCFCAAVF